MGCRLWVLDGVRMEGYCAYNFCDLRSSANDDVGM